MLLTLFVNILFKAQNNNIQQKAKTRKINTKIFCNEFTIQRQ